jgi:hypothetical protein
VFSAKRRNIIGSQVADQYPVLGSADEVFLSQYRYRFLRFFSQLRERGRFHPEPARATAGDAGLKGNSCRQRLRASDEATGYGVATV